MVTVLILSLAGCSSQNKWLLNRIKEKMIIDLKDCTVEVYRDTHGGMSDGELLAQVKCTAEQLSYVSENWKKLPISGTLKKELSENISSSEIHRSDLLTVKNGYYCFLDRHREATDPHNETEFSNINERYSYNYSVAVFDSYSNTLYYYELDT